MREVEDPAPQRGVPCQASRLGGGQVCLQREAQGTPTGAWTMSLQLNVVGTYNRGHLTALWDYECFLNDF